MMNESLESISAEVGEPCSLDRICGDWSIYQLKKGHRFSTDDMLTAWIGVREWKRIASGGVPTLIDLGAGIGSVGLMALWQMPETTRTTFIEVQAVSHQLCRRTIQYNRLQERVSLHLADLRDPSSLPEDLHGSCDLVTGSPPYFPVGAGVVSPHPQRAGARFELKGDVFDYCRAAAKALAPDGVFAFVHAAGDARPEQAITDAGLTLVRHQDVLFREGRTPTIALFVAAWKGEKQTDPPLVVRNAAGEWTDEYLVIRQEMGALS